MTKPVIGITCHMMPDASRSAIVQRYVEAIVAAGGAPIGIPIGLGGEGQESVFEVIDGLLLPGGDDVAPDLYHDEPHPNLGAVDRRRDHLEIDAARWALSRRIPVLGICRGVQVLAVAAGGTLYQDIPSQLEGVGAHDVHDFGFDHLCHTVTVEPGTHFHAAVGSTETGVNSFHHQAVRDVPPGFIVSARAGDGVIEGIEGTDHPFAVGVQCHPEGIWNTTAPEFLRLFEAFVVASGRGRLARTA